MQNNKQQMNEQQGLVISYFGNSILVETPEGNLIQCHLHRNQTLPVVGDQVMFSVGASETGVVNKILPRRSQLAKGDARGKMKVIAANVDRIIIMMVPPPIFSEYLIDRYLVAAELLHIEPLIVVNKIDLLDETSKAATLSKLETYQAIGYPTLTTSILQNQGLDELKALIKDKVSVLVGPSGVGKSSMIQRFNQDDQIKIGDVSGKGLGKHTTTATRLYHFPGGDLIDSPGVREFNLWPIEKEAVLNSFREFLPFVAECRFRNCQHLAEPGCAIHQAIEEGQIARSRYESYKTLIAAASARSR